MNTKEISAPVARYNDCLEHVRKVLSIPIQTLWPAIALPELKESKTLADLMDETHSKWHREGSMLMHTAMVYCEMLGLIDKHQGLNARILGILTSAAIYHDIGKPFSHIYFDTLKGLATKPSSEFPMHDWIGANIFLRSYDVFGKTFEEAVIIALLIGHHMHKYERMVPPVLCDLWHMLREADAKGRTPQGRVVTDTTKSKATQDFHLYTGIPDANTIKDYELVILIGSPKSGKTYLVSKWIASEHVDPATWVSTDRIRLQLAEKQGLFTYDMDEATKYEIAFRETRPWSIFYNQITETYKKHGIAIVDSTAIIPKYRRMIHARATRARKIAMIVLTPPWDVILTRNLRAFKAHKRGEAEEKVIPDEILIKHIYGLVHPYPAELRREDVHIDVYYAPSVDSYYGKVKELTL